MQIDPHRDFSTIGDEHTVHGHATNLTLRTRKKRFAVFGKRAVADQYLSYRAPHTGPERCSSVS